MQRKQEILKNKDERESAPKTRKALDNSLLTKMQKSIAEAKATANSHPAYCINIGLFGTIKSNENTQLKRDPIHQHRCNEIDDLATSKPKPNKLRRV